MYQKRLNHLAEYLKNVVVNGLCQECVLVLINLPFSKIAQILPYAPNSIGKLKDTTAKHLGTTGKELRKFLLNLSIYSH